MAAPRYAIKESENKRKDIEQIEALASLPASVGIPDSERERLREVVNKSVAAVQSQTIAPPVEAAKVEKLEPDPDQSRLNFQLALSRLVNDEEVQKQARLDGKAFQARFNLTNDQMLTLCRLAIDAGIYKDTEDLNKFLDRFQHFPAILKSLSPGAKARLNLDLSDDLAIVGSCSCCCP